MRFIDCIRFGCVGLLINGVVACSPTDETSMSDANVLTSSEKVDFAALLTRTDHVEVCVRGTGEHMVTTFGDDFVPDRMVQTACECMSDGIRDALEQVRPGEPALHNAILQVAMNLEVIRVIFNKKEHPGNLEAFAVFMNEEGRQTLGFDNEEFNSALKTAGSLLQSLTQEELVASFPSCAAALKITRAQFPSVDFDSDPHYSDRAYAIRRLEFDTGVDLSGLDVVLTSQYPLELCKTISSIPSKRGTPPESPEDIARSCENMLDSFDIYLKDFPQSDRLAAVRIALGIIYVGSHKTTANGTDVFYYVFENAERFDWTKPQLKAIASRLSDQTDAKWWHDFEAILDGGTLPSS